MLNNRLFFAALLCATLILGVAATPLSSPTASSAHPSGPGINRVRILWQGPETYLVVLAPQNLTPEALKDMWQSRVETRLGIVGTRGFVAEKGLVLMEVSTMLTVDDIDVLCSNEKFPLRRLPDLSDGEIEKLMDLAHGNGWR